MKEKIPTCKIVCSDPVGSTMALPPEINKTDVDFFELEGIGYDYVPSTLHRDLVDEWVKVTDQEAFPMARRFLTNHINSSFLLFKLILRLIREEGILTGGSSGANLAGALKACKNLKEGQRCVVILPDGVRNYMTKFLSDSWMAERFLDHIVALPEQWWHKEDVSSLELKKPIMVSPQTSCEEALKLLEENNCRYVVIQEPGFEGYIKICIIFVTK